MTTNQPKSCADSRGLSNRNIKKLRNARHEKQKPFFFRRRKKTQPDRCKELLLIITRLEKKSWTRDSFIHARKLYELKEGCDQNQTCPTAKGIREC